MDEIPTIEARLIEVMGVDLYEFDCPHCRKVHRHGVSGGHRRAHCTSPTSPYRKTGYVLVRAGDANPCHIKT